MAEEAEDSVEDEITDGFLLRGENFQAVGLLVATVRADRRPLDLQLRPVRGRDRRPDDRALPLHAGGDDQQSGAARV